MLYEELKHDTRMFQEPGHAPTAGSTGPPYKLDSSLCPMSLVGTDQGIESRMIRLFGGLFDGGSLAPPSLSPDALNHAGSHAAERTPEYVAGPKTGLDSYQVVLDGFIGPLATGQIHSSEFSKLKKYGFGKMPVVEDGFLGPLSKQQMTQSQFDQLAHGWLNILDNQGMKIEGSGKSQKKDEETFRRMMANGMVDSPTCRGLISSIGNDRAPAHQIEAKVGRNQPGVIFDDFDSKAIDLADLGKLPARPGTKHPNEFSRTENIIHFLAERQFAQKSAHPADYDPAHLHGLEVQNQYRAEHGQASMRSQTGTQYPDGSVKAIFGMAGGVNETMDISANSKVRRITPP